MDRKKKIISLVGLGILVVGLVAAYILAQTSQNIQKKAANTTVKFSLYPTTETFVVGGGRKSYRLVATFTGDSTTERIDYLKAEVTFNKAYLSVPSDGYAKTDFTTNTPNLDNIIRVDGPIAANASGSIVVEMGIAKPNTGPLTSAKTYTIADLYFEGKANTPSEQDLTITKSEVVSNSKVTLASTTPQNAKYTVTGGSTTVLPTSGASGSGTPIPSNTSAPTIPISGTGSVTVTIAADAVYGTFKAKLLSVENTPEVKVMLRATDVLARITPGAGSTASCQEAGPGQYLYKDITMAADSSGIYSPKPGSTFTYNGASHAVSSDGWLPLAGLTPGRVYSFSLKGPMHRSMIMVSNFTVASGKATVQNFDWIAKPLEPGDLPNPNNNNLQDCVVNSIDLSLITERIGSTDASDLEIADVNYDGIINGNDVSMVVKTLSTKSDEEN